MSKWIIEDNLNGYSEPNGVPLSILRIAQRRGVKDEELENFFSNTPKCTYDPFLLPNMQEVCERLIEVCKEGKRICVYGDYDADGVTSTTLMYQILSHYTDNLTFFIPSRFTDGYGPSNGAFDKLKEDEVDFIVTVDCGITSKKEIEYAKNLGMEVIVTDHHIIRDEFTPDCLIVNPHLPGCSYPFKDLSGCGVAFKIAQGINRIDPEFSKATLNSFLDLVAISTVADVVPLQDENRALVKYGLDRINRRERKGLTALLEELDLKAQIVSSDISFTIAPNINALGRMGRADNGVELLLSDLPDMQLRQLAKDIVETNIARKEVQAKTADICKTELETQNCGEYAPVILAKGAHEGVAGIVAGNLKEDFYKPVCIVSPTKDGSLKGTGRSIPGINLHQLFENCGDVFERFGGHAGACGFTLKQDKVDEFRASMQYLVKQIVDENPEVLEKTYNIEKVLCAEEKTLDFVEKLSMLEPFGEANPTPIFAITNAEVYDVRTLGTDGQHIKFTAISPDGIEVECIAFNSAEKYLDTVGFGRVDVCGELSINEFRGKKQLQIKVADIRRNNG